MARRLETLVISYMLKFVPGKARRVALRRKNLERKVVGSIPGEGDSLFPLSITRWCYVLFVLWKCLFCDCWNFIIVIKQCTLIVCLWYLHFGKRPCDNIFFVPASVVSDGKDFASFVLFSRDWSMAKSQQTKIVTKKSIKYSHEIPFRDCLLNLSVPKGKTLS